MTIYKRAFCTQCERERRFQKLDLDQKFHALACVCTLGLWVLLWLPMEFRRLKRPWRCGWCGSRLRNRSSLAAGPLLDSHDGVRSLDLANSPQSRTTIRHDAY